MWTFVENFLVKFFYSIASRKKYTDYKGNSRRNTAIDAT